MLSNTSWGTLDPAKIYTVLGFQSSQYVADGLVGFRRAAGVAGTVIVPDLATSVPAPTGGGKTYTFHVRPRVQVGYSQWHQDYPAPSDFLNVLLGCSYYHPGSDASPARVPVQPPGSAGMSPGNAMYYFATLEEMLIEALRFANDGFLQAELGVAGEPV